MDVSSPNISKLCLVDTLLDTIDLAEFAGTFIRWYGRGVQRRINISV